MIDSKIGLENLLLIKNILGGKRWWLDCGTLLGALRDKKFITHDTDIDIGILSEDFSPKYISELQRVGFVVYHTWGNEKKGLEISLIRKGVKVDIFLYYRKEDKRWHGMYLRDGSNYKLIKCVFQADLVEKTKKYTFLGKSFPIPNQPIKYIVARYGKDWEIVDKKWIWHSSPFCIDNFFRV